MGLLPMPAKIAERSCRRRHQNRTTSGNPSPTSEGDETVDLSEFFRLPAPGKRCERSGLTRGTYNDLIFADPPKIKSVVVKQPGATRGVRLLYWPSVRRYLLDLMEEQLAGAPDHMEEVIDE